MPNNYLSAVADAYRSASEKIWTTELVRAWYALADDTARLFAAIPIEVVPVNDLEPYSSCVNMVCCVAATGVLRVNDLAHNHPIWTDRENFQFRAVHDWFGHIQGTRVTLNPERFAFNARGELNAYQFHADCHFRRESLPALFCEIVGQVAWQHANGEFPEQACAIIPGFSYSQLPLEVL